MRTPYSEGSPGATSQDESEPRDLRPAWIETIAPAAAQGVLADVYARISARSGTVAHVLRCQSLHPEGLRDHYGLYRTLMYGEGALSRAERESIAVVVSAVNGCRY